MTRRIRRCADCQEATDLGKPTRCTECPDACHICAGELQEDTALADLRVCLPCGERIQRAYVQAKSLPLATK